MKNTFIFFLCCLLVKVAAGQTFTMGNKCYEQSKAAAAFLAEKKHAEALEAYSTMEKSCKTKDAREQIQSGKAAALNGLGQYEDALVASDLALKASKNKSISAWFQKAMAFNALNRPQDASNCFSKLVALTEKNRDNKAKASNYALLANLHQQQLNNKDSAAFYLEKAKSLDPQNAQFYLLEGDWRVAEGNYDAAFEAYDKSVSMGKSDLDMYVTRMNARMKMVQEKYGTTNAQELRSKMTAEEKELICREIKAALDKGLREMKWDMFSSLVCK